MDAQATVLGELRGLRQRVPGVSGVVVATVDGMLLAWDAPGVDPDPVAALTATSLGLGQQFARSIGHGPVQESILRTAGGLIATYPAGANALLAVLARDGVDLALLNLEGHAVAHRVGLLCKGARGWAVTPSSPGPDDRCAPRPARVQSPMSPAGLPMRRGVRRPPGRP
mgnify:CR=1 FL=1